jgi:hypothetical protein
MIRLAVDFAEAVEVRGHLAYKIEEKRQLCQTIDKSEEEALRIATGPTVRPGCELHMWAQHPKTDHGKREFLADLSNVVEQLLGGQRVPNVAKSGSDIITGSTSTTEGPASTREPSHEAFTAYRIWEQVGKTQVEIAEILTRELKRPVDQGTVSRWIGSVKKWREAGNKMPSLPEPARRKPTPVDPSHLDLGPRQIPTTKRQRHSDD